MLPDTLGPFEEIARNLDDYNKRLESLERQRSGSNRLIDSAVLTAPAASVIFSNIPNIYDHLLLLTYIRGTRNAGLDTLGVRFNGDAGVNYDWLRVQINTGGLVTAGVIAFTEVEVGFFAAATAPANTFDMGWTRINNYANANSHKSILAMSGAKDANFATNVFVFLHSGWWRNITAISTIFFFPRVGPNFDTGSRFDLYGIQGG